MSFVQSQSRRPIIFPSPNPPPFLAGGPLSSIYKRGLQFPIAYKKGGLVVKRRIKK